jgi:hypothetical protein
MTLKMIDRTSFGTGCLDSEHAERHYWCLPTHNNYAILCLIVPTTLRVPSGGTANQGGSSFCLREGAGLIHSLSRVHLLSLAWHVL